MVPDAVGSAVFTTLLKLPTKPCGAEAIAARDGKTFEEMTIDLIKEDVAKIEARRR
jgi:hypothetical protein